MSCLRIKLFPAKRAWKSLTAKFHKLRRSKTKPKTRYAASSSLCSNHRSRKNHQDKRDCRVFHIRLKKGCFFKKKRKSVVYVEKLFREPISVTNWIPAKQWKPKKDSLPEKRGIDERAEEFIARMKAEMLASRNL